MLKVIIWFLVINFSIYNTIFPEPLSMFWFVVVEIIALLISIYMAKQFQAGYTKTCLKICLFCLLTAAAGYVIIERAAVGRRGTNSPVYHTLGILSSEI